MRHWMESAGWRQGGFVQQKDLPTLICLYPDVGITEDIYLVVASQSCDIAHAQEPMIEFMIARKKDKMDGNFAHNKHPRKLHIEAIVDNEGQIERLSLEIKAHEKICLLKDDFPESLIPESYIELELNSLKEFVAWLAGRYQRPALPTEFDRRFDEKWKKDKRRKFTEKGSEHILGIYVEITPDEEIEEDKNYSVNLLIIVAHDISKMPEEDSESVRLIASEYAEKMREANMDVVGPLIFPEEGISVATLKRYKRFILDDLSYKSDHPLPSETKLP